MTYDLEIAMPGNGPVRFKVPDASVSGIAKLAQRVMLTLLSDDGEMMKLASGGATTATLTDDVLARERSRVIDAVAVGTSEDSPADETIAQLKLSQIPSSGTRVSVEVEVIAVSGITEEITLKL